MPTSQFSFSGNVTHVNDKLRVNPVIPQFVIYMSNDVSGEVKLTS